MATKKGLQGATTRKAARRLPTIVAPGAITAADRRAARRDEKKHPHKTPGRKTVVAPTPASPLPEPHLDPAQMGDYISQWGQQEQIGLGATQEYQAALDADPGVRAKIESLYRQGIRNTGQAAAARGLAGQGISDNMLTDVSRSHTLADTAQTDFLRHAQARHDQILLGVQKQQGLLKTGAVGMKLGNLYSDDYYATAGTPGTTAPGVAAAQPTPAPPGPVTPAHPGRPYAAPPPPPGPFSPNALQRQALARIKPGVAGNTQRSQLLNLWSRQPRRA